MELEIIAKDETFIEMEKRHKAEVRKLEGEIRALLKTAKKSTKAQIETQALRMQYELKERHSEEIENFSPGSEYGYIEDVVDVSENVDKNEQESLALKKAKAKRKQDKKKTKDLEKESLREVIQAANSGPSLRDIELSAINSKLSAISLQVQPVISDGNCLYRAVADQLVTCGLDPYDHNSLRVLASSYINTHALEFCPFLGIDDPESHEFVEYCNKVASPILAEWGGQLEIKALSAALNVAIHVYSADSPTIYMDESVNNAVSKSSSALHPIYLTYHKNYYALGEHYNSVVPISVL